MYIFITAKEFSKVHNYNIGQVAQVFGYGLDSSGDGRMEIFIHAFMSRLVLVPTQPPVN